MCNRDLNTRHQNENLGIYRQPRFYFSFFCSSNLVRSIFTALPSGATESNRSQFFRRVLLENGPESMATIGMNVQSRSPRGGFLLVLIWQNLGPKLPQALETVLLSIRELKGS